VRLRAGVVEEARIVLTGTGSRPHIATAAAEALVGRRIDDVDARAEAADRAARLAKPLDNTDFALGWRKQMARHHVTAALADLV
jgi:CO/xanthine dehydrogenase FAD-binding subunit